MAVGEWDQRQLCPDGACVGVIGPGGTCKVCGRAAPNWGDERNRGLINPEDGADLAADRADDEEEDDEDDDEEDGDDEDYGDDDDDDDDDEDEDDDEAPEPEAAAAPAGAWSARRLCPDGACIGVIGPDGRCKVCGRRASGAPAEPPGGLAIEPPIPAASAEPPAGDREPCATPGCSSQIGADGRCAVCGKGAS